eukprot:CAMPEP_0115043008 /NCGR_PEP_ID=MMETSP0216-20121206/46606_1 /TAXON_ID=223996 /ORGANISM="Protocruzia adherens, Strain Boccale" /LENGTH=460 /DNA_ID=CAMNT_0002425233 /DNA_START=60 /DNA_END=1439 /DNA_ORIENTATION=+
MDFPFNCDRVCSADNDGFSVIAGSRFRSRVDAYYQNLSKIIEEMGEASSRAQGLTSTITTPSRFFGSDQRLYLRTEGKRALGLLKVGSRKLFIRNEVGQIKEITPLCVLDFYVHESCQRMGIGKDLFEYMLEEEKIEPAKIAYDRPSPKLIGFLRKHYGLSSYVPQNNNYVVFQQYFNPDLGQRNRPTSRTSSSRTGVRNSEAATISYDAEEEYKQKHERKSQDIEYQTIQHNTESSNPRRIYNDDRSNDIRSGGGNRTDLGFYPRNTASRNQKNRSEGVSGLLGYPGEDSPSYRNCSRISAVTSHSQAKLSGLSTAGKLMIGSPSANNRQGQGQDRRPNSKQNRSSCPRYPHRESAASVLQREHKRNMDDLENNMADLKLTGTEVRLNKVNRELTDTKTLIKSNMENMRILDQNSGYNRSQTSTHQKRQQQNYEPPWATNATANRQQFERSSEGYGYGW